MFLVIPDNVFTKMNVLEILDISSNFIDVLHTCSFLGLKSLTTLAIESNSVKIINKYAFFGLKNLPQLSLSRQELAEMQCYALYGLEMLTHLDLSQNAISELHQGIFAGLKCLRSLDMTHNEISFIDATTFATLSKYLEVFVDSSATCCFLVPCQLCQTKSNTSTISCTKLINKSSYRKALITMLVMIPLWDIPPMIWNLQRYIRRVKKSTLNTVYLHAFDSLMSFSFVILIAKDDEWGIQFPFQYLNWFQDPACKMIGSIAIFSIQSSLCTRLFISVEQYIVACNPFKVDEMMANWFIALYFHWLLAVIITIIHLVLVIPTDTMCSHLVQYPPTFIYIGVLTTTLAIDCILTVTITFLSGSALKMLYMSRISSGRQITEKDKQLNVRTVVIMVFNMIFMLLFLVFTILVMLVDDFADHVAEVFIMFILPVPAFVDPVIYTLTTNEVLSRFS